VNGKIVIDHGEHTGARAGAYSLRSGKRTNSMRFCFRSGSVCDSCADLRYRSGQRPRDGPASGTDAVRNIGIRDGKIA